MQSSCMLEARLAQLRKQQSSRQIYFLLESTSLKEKDVKGLLSTRIIACKAVDGQEGRPSH